MKVFSPLFATVLAAFLFITACSHKDAPGTVTPPPTPALSVDKTTITQMAAAGTASIAVTSNISWKVTSSQTWATISPATGSNNGNVTVTIAANGGTDLRTADITIASSESGSSLTPYVIKITQGGSDPYLVVDKTNVTIAGVGGTQDVKVTSNVNWASRTTLIPTSPNPPIPFISVDKTNGIAGETTVHYTIAANTTVDIQKADVLYTGVGVEPVKTTFTEAVDYKFTNFSPAGAAVGSSVTLTGVFGPNPIIKINGVQATMFGVATDRKSITFQVPMGATSGKITVEIGGITSTSATDFVVYGISSFAPASLASNDQITAIEITGGFIVTSAPVVKVNGVVATVYNYTATSIIIRLPVGATDGKITVTSGGTTYTSPNNFVVTNRWVQVSGGHGAYYSRKSIGFVLSNKFYVGLGENAASSLTNDFHIFDPSNNSWHQGPVIPTAMSPRVYASCFVKNDTAYIGFGLAAGNLSDWWSYDASGKWTQLTSFATAGYGGLAFVVNNVPYAGASAFTGDISSFNSSLLSANAPWTPVLTHSLLGNYYSSSFVIGSDAYIIGGYTNLWTPVCYRYNPNAGTVSSISNIPYVSAFMPSFSINNHGYVIDTYTQHMYMFDPATGTWSDTQANLPVYIGGVYNAQVINGTAYAFTQDGVVYKFIP